MPNTPNPWSSVPPAANFEPQLGSTNKIAGNDSRLQTCLLRNGSVWCTQTAFLPAGAVTRSAVQWWQITPTTGTVVQFGRVDDSTGSNQFAFPSIAVSKFNDALVGYASFSATQYASARGSFRFSSDAPGTTPVSISVKSGLAPYFKTFSGTTNRWGDYTTSVVDPVDDRTLWTLQEFASTPSGGFDKWDTWWLSYDSNGAPVNSSLTPNSGAGTSGVFTAVYTDPNGFSDLSTMSLLVNTAVNSKNACYVVYTRAQNNLYLVNDAGSGFLGPLTPGGAGTVQNSQCQLAAAGSSASGVGTTFSLAANLTFFSSFVGLKNLYLYATDTAGASTGFVQFGSWTTGTNVPPVNVSVTPSSGSGTNQVFSAVFSDANGFADLASVYLLVGSAVNSANSCYVLYLRSSNALYLASDAGSPFLGPVAVGSASTLQNSQCRVNAATSTAVGSGNSFTLAVSLSFLAYSGQKNLYLYATDSSNASSGFSSLGTWSPVLNQPPVNVSISPNSGTGASQTFTAAFSDGNGFADLATMSILVNTSASAVNGCYVIYYRSSNAMYLVNDAGTAVLGPLTPGGTGTVQNGQCTLTASTSSASGSGNSFSFSASLTFLAAFAGPKNMYLYATDSTGANSGFSSLGTWSPAVNQPPVNVSISPNSGTGASQTFTAAFSDGNGFADLATMSILVNTSASAVNGCYVIYYRSSNAMYLVNDAGTAVLGPLTPGGAGAGQNGQCTLTASSSSASGSGNSFSFGASLTFLAGFTGTKNTYLYATDTSAASSGFSQLGTWTH